MLLQRGLSSSEILLRRIVVTVLLLLLLLFHMTNVLLVYFSTTVPLQCHFFIVMMYLQLVVTLHIITVICFHNSGFQTPHSPNRNSSSPSTVHTKRGLPYIVLFFYPPRP
jgi:hypothetical protein